MQLLFSEELDNDLVNKLIDAFQYCLKIEGIQRDVEISLSIVDAEEIQRLNREYRGMDEVTDVLSFPLMEREDLENLKMPDLPIGDIVLCREKIIEQAEEFGHSEERELVYLSVHSLLHLLGHDHIITEEKKIMREKEEEVMEYIGLAR